MKKKKEVKLEGKGLDFVGFNKEKFTLKITHPAIHHNHLEVWLKGNFVGYFHLSKNTIDFYWGRGAEEGGSEFNETIHLGREGKNEAAL